MTGSFKAFLDRHNFQSLLPLFKYLFSMMGYGRPEDHPSYYGIFFFNPKVLEGIKQKLQQNNGLQGLRGIEILSILIVSVLKCLESIGQDRTGHPWCGHTDFRRWNNFWEIFIVRKGRGGLQGGYKFPKFCYNTQDGE